MDYKKKQKALQDEFSENQKKIQGLNQQINQILVRQENIKGQFSLLEELNKEK